MTHEPLLMDGRFTLVTLISTCRLTGESTAQRHRKTPRGMFGDAFQKDTTASDDVLYNVPPHMPNNANIIVKAPTGFETTQVHSFEVITLVNSSANVRIQQYLYLF